MKLVKFNDGSYGIRKRYWIFWYKFYDFTSRNSYWWSLSKYPDDIKTTKNEAESKLLKLKDFGTEGKPR